MAGVERGFLDGVAEGLRCRGEIVFLLVGGELGLQDWESQFWGAFGGEEFVYRVVFVGGVGGCRYVCPAGGGVGDLETFVGGGALFAGCVWHFGFFSLFRFGVYI